MMIKNTKPACMEQIHQVCLKDLPLSCPSDDMTLWNAHPKVYLPIEQSGDETCPYCGTRYVLQHD